VRIFLDANILFSTAMSDGAVRHLVNDLLADGHVLVVNDYVLEEARRNLALKAHDGIKVLDRLKQHLEMAVLAVAPLHAVPAALAEKDRPVLGAAIQARCEALVTGDRRDFGRFYGRAFGGVTIHSPLSLARVLLA
jgi:uncharacterized protein